MVYNYYFSEQCKWHDNEVAEIMYVMTVNERIARVALVNASPNTNKAATLIQVSTVDKCKITKNWKYSVLF